MKKMLSGLVVIALLGALAGTAQFVRANIYQEQATAVSLVIQDELTGEKHVFYEAMVTDQVGNTTYGQETWKSLKSADQVTVSIKVTSTYPLRRDAWAHFVIASGDEKSTVDLPLLVWKEVPEPSQWMKLGNHFKFAAYRCRTVVAM